MKKKKVTRTKYRAEYPGEFVFDYKDPQTLGRFIMEGGKVIPSRISKLSMSQQRAMTNAVRKARVLCLLPSGNEAHDRFRFAEPIRPVPFEY